MHLETSRAIKQYMYCIAMVAVIVAECVFYRN